MNNSKSFTVVNDTLKGFKALSLDKFSFVENEEPSSTAINIPTKSNREDLNNALSLNYFPLKNQPTLAQVNLPVVTADSSARVLNLGVTMTGSKSSGREPKPVTDNVVQVKDLNKTPPQPQKSFATPHNASSPQSGQTSSNNFTLPMPQFNKPNDYKFGFSQFLSYVAPALGGLSVMTLAAASIGPLALTGALCFSALLLSVNILRHFNVGNLGDIRAKIISNTNTATQDDFLTLLEHRKQLQETIDSLAAQLTTVDNQAKAKITAQINNLMQMFNAMATGK